MIRRLWVFSRSPNSNPSTKLRWHHFWIPWYHFWTKFGHNSRRVGRTGRLCFLLELSWFFFNRLCNALNYTVNVFFQVTFLISSSLEEIAVMGVFEAIEFESVVKIEMTSFLDDLGPMYERNLGITGEWWVVRAWWRLHHTSSRILHKDTGTLAKIFGIGQNSYTSWPFFFYQFIEFVWFGVNDGH